MYTLQDVYLVSKLLLPPAELIKLVVTLLPVDVLDPGALVEAAAVARPLLHFANLGCVAHVARAPACPVHVPASAPSHALKINMLHATGLYPLV